jgi:hypothetical protein
MNQLGIVVPFSVFTEYRNRRLLGGDIARAEPGPDSVDTVSPSQESGCVDVSFTSAETTVPTEPATERILS